MGEFTDKIVLITGAASGIGKTTAEAFAREGAKIVIADIDKAGSDAVVKKITSAGGKAEFQRCDVRKSADVEALAGYIDKTYGGLDCAVNNAGVDPEVTAEPSWDLYAFDLIHSTNVRGVFVCMKNEMPLILKKGGGAIVNLSSFAGVRGIANKPSYVSSKHAVLGLTRASALQYAARGIRINAVCPGPIETPMLKANLDARPSQGQERSSAVAMDRIGETREIADAILWLCSNHASFVTGQGLSVDGGMAV